MDVWMKIEVPDMADEFVTRSMPEMEGEVARALPRMGDGSLVKVTGYVSRPVDQSIAQSLAATSEFWQQPGKSEEWAASLESNYDPEARA